MCTSNALARYLKVLFVSMLAVVVGCSSASDAVSPTVQSVVANVNVTLNQPTLTLGQTAQASATIQDSAGNPLSGQLVVWRSLAESVARVSSAGAVTAVGPGSSIIEGTVAGKVGAAPLLVVTAPDLASHDFEDATWGPYVHFVAADEDIVNDPTGSGRSKVARFHYAGANQDRNRSLEYSHATRMGESIYSRGEFYLPSPVGITPPDGFYQRKLLYWHPHVDYTKYGSAGGPVFYSIVKLVGASLVWIGGYVPQQGSLVEYQSTVASGLDANRWYSLETQTTLNSSLSSNDGIVRVWLDGLLIYEKTNMRWTDPAWIGQSIGGVPLDANDVYFQRYDVGQQVNYLSGSFDEYRYWDNVAFSTHRIGR